MASKPSGLIVEDEGFTTTDTICPQVRIFSLCDVNSLLVEFVIFQARDVFSHFDRPHCTLHHPSLKLAFIAGIPASYRWYERYCEYVRLNRINHVARQAKIAWGMKDPRK